METIIRNFNKELDLNEIISYIFTCDRFESTPQTLIDSRYTYNVLYQNIYFRSIKFNKNNEYNRIITALVDNLQLSVNCIVDKKSLELYLSRYIKCIDNICDICISYGISTLRESLYQILIDLLLKYNSDIICKFLISEWSNKTQELIIFILNNCNEIVKDEKKTFIINFIIDGIFNKIFKLEDIYLLDTLTKYNRYVDFLDSTRRIYSNLKSNIYFDEKFIDLYREIRLKYIYNDFYNLINVIDSNLRDNIIHNISESYVFLDDKQTKILINELEQYYKNELLSISFDNQNDKLYYDINRIISKIYMLTSKVDNKLDSLHINVISRLINENNIDFYANMINNDFVNFYKQLCKTNDKNDLYKVYENMYLKLYFLKHLTDPNVCFLFFGNYYKCLQNRLLNYNINNVNRLTLINAFESNAIDLIKENLLTDSNVLERERKYWLPKLNNIIKDIHHSIYYTLEFRKSKFSFLNNDLKFNKNNSNYMILSNHSWTNIHPFMKSNYTILYPDKLKIYIASLEQHYKLSCPYKKLHIINHLSTYTLNWNITSNTINKKIIIKCNLIQAAAIMLFEKLNCTDVHYFDDDIHRLLFGSVCITSDSINYISRVLKSLVEAKILVYDNTLYSLNMSNISNKAEINAIKYFDLLDNVDDKINTYNDNIMSAEKEILVDCHIMKYVKHNKEKSIDDVFKQLQYIFSTIDKPYLLKRFDKLVENYYIEIIDDKVIYLA